MDCGLQLGVANLIFEFCGMCQVFAQWVTYNLLRVDIPGVKESIEVLFKHAKIPEQVHDLAETLTLIEEKNANVVLQRKGLRVHGQVMNCTCNFPHNIYPLPFRYGMILINLEMQPAPYVAVKLEDLLKFLDPEEVLGFFADRGYFP